MGILIECENRQIAEKEPVGLDRSTVERLGNLEKLRYLEKMRGNPQGHIQNIDAIMETYRSRKLKWTPQLVTFWSKGKQLSKPRPFDWDELEAIKKELATRGSFWVEGVRFFFRIHCSMKACLAFLRASPYTKSIDVSAWTGIQSRVRHHGSTGVESQYNDRKLTKPEEIIHSTVNDYANIPEVSYYSAPSQSRVANSMVGRNGVHS